MTRRPRIHTLDQADEALGRLRYLRYAGMPQKPIAELLEVAAYYRAEIERLQARQGDKMGWAERVTK